MYVLTVITASSAVTAQGEFLAPMLTIDDGTIVSVQSREAAAVPAHARHLDFPGAVLAPGLVDIHIHGSAGHDLMEGSPSSLAAIETFLARRGVTSYLPTTVTASREATLYALKKLGRACDSGASTGRAKPRGLHLEGPFISTAKCGVHPVADILAPDITLLDDFWDASASQVRMLTMAPELPGAVEFIRHARKLGIRISVGHSNATAAETYAAIDAGASHATHTFNAMRALDHREPGILGAVLSDPRLSADIIVDKVHLAPEAVRLFFRAKGGDRSVLITDAISATGMPDGVYRLGGFDVEVRHDTCLLNGRLAGSVLTLEKAVRNLTEICGVPLAFAVRCASTNAARSAGLERVGALEPGCAADIAVFSTMGEIMQTFIDGIPVHG